VSSARIQQLMANRSSDQPEEDEDQGTLPGVEKPSKPKLPETLPERRRTPRTQTDEQQSRLPEPSDKVIQPEVPMPPTVDLEKEEVIPRQTACRVCGSSNYNLASCAVCRVELKFGTRKSTSPVLNVAGEPRPVADLTEDEENTLESHASQGCPKCRGNGIVFEEGAGRFPCPKCLDRYYKEYKMNHQRAIKAWQGIDPNE